MRAPKPVHEIEQWAEDIRRVVDLYNQPVRGLRDEPRGPDYEAAHGAEDALLERFVRDMAYEGDPRAALLIEILDLPRTRWYA